jgi:outer membrane receptor protein involved in Fe transport
VAIFYEPTRSLTFKYNYNDSSRAPRGNEVYNAQQLKIEKNQAHELAASLNLPKVQANVNVFVQKVTDEIERDPTGFNNFANVGRESSNGVEYDAKYRPVHALLLYLNGAYTRATDLNKNAVKFQPELVNMLGVEYTTPRIVIIAADMRDNARIPYTTLSGGNERYSGIIFYDATVRSERLMNRLELSFNVLNLFNEAKGVPAFGEHAQNANGLMPPEARKYYAKASLYF